MVATAKNEAPQGAVRRSVLVGLFVGTAVGAGYLLAGVPNLELMTFLNVLAGAVLGPGLGAFCGGASAAIFSLGNPVGVPVPVLLAGQILGMGFAGWLGGRAAEPILARLRGGRQRLGAVLCAVLGVAATFVFDLATNLASLIAFDLEPRVLAVGALPFALIHQAGNLPLFLIVLPLVLPRFVGLARASLRGGGARAGVLALLVLLVSGEAAGVQPALPDSAAVPDSLLAEPGPPAAGLADSSGLLPPPPVTRDRQTLWPGGRPLWDPFAPEVIDLLDRRTLFVPVIDGGFGARVVLLQEAGTSPFPLFTRDGIPLGTGHRWADDPWTVPITGLELAGAGFGLDGFGGTGGLVRLVSADTDPEEPVLDTRFFKGPHETYLRSLAFRTPRAPWRLRFEFEETLDNEGYPFQVAGDGRYISLQPFLGESRFRCGRGTLTRIVSAGTDLSLSVQTTRKHKTSLPASGLNHENFWGDHAALTWRDRTRAGSFRASLFWTGADVERNWDRKLEAAREGVLLELAGGPRRDRFLRLSALNWRIDDSGADPAWAGADSGRVQESGHEAAVELAAPWRWGGLGLAANLCGWWDSYAGLLVGGRVALAPRGDNPWWRLAVESGGRSPRSDELLTADRFSVPLGSVRVSPNRDLEREKTLRASGVLQGRLLGTDLAVTGSLRWLRNGITWTAAADDPQAGAWTNDLEMQAQTVTARVERRGRFAGWVRLQAESVWRFCDVQRGRPTLLPPERSAAAQVLWENHFFREDGILEIGYRLAYRGSLNDPWWPAGEIRLPAVTRHDLLLGFRLLGADLSLAVRNLTNQVVQAAAGSLSTGREFRWRLHWKFSQ